MTVVVFRGPTITADAVRTALPGNDVTCLPPAAQGDLHRAVRGGARTVVLIDGTFERGPAVWHKEILDALHRGVTVFGAASMGALRAVECAPFGMRGVGQIVSWYADGTLTDDDEVTVAHLDCEHDWRVISDAMVNIRATLTAAVGAGVLAQPDADRLVVIAKSTFYPERSWPRLLARVTDEGIDTTAMRSWLPDHRVDLKNLDARAALDAVAVHLRNGAPPPNGPRPEPSRSWLRACTAMAGATTAHGVDAVLDALRLDDAYVELHQAALLRHLAVAEAERHGVDPEPHTAVDALREALGLADDRSLATWCAANDLDDAGLRRLSVNQSRLSWVHRRLTDEVDASIADQLRIRGWYRTASPGGSVPHGAEHGEATDVTAAWDWYASTRDLAGRGWPDPRDGADQLAALAAHLGFDTTGDLERAVLNAYRTRAA